MSRIDPRTARTTAAILDAAEALFGERGFHDATMDEIAEAAGVAVGSIYFHFGSKEALHLALVERALDVNERYMAAAYGHGRSPLEEVLAAGDAYLRFHLEHPGYFRMIALAPEVNSPEGQRRIADRVERLVGAVGDAIARAAAAGEVAVDDAQDAAVFLWGAWNGVVALHQRQDRLRLDDARLVEILELGKQIVLRGLTP